MTAAIDVCPECEGVGEWVEDVDKEFGVLVVSCSLCQGHGYIKLRRKVTR